DSSFALLGAGRAKLALGRPREAIELMSKASPSQSLADYYLGAAYEALGDDATALEAYKRAVGADSYFHEGRATLTRSYIRMRRYNDAWRHLQRLIEADPGSKLARAMLARVRPLIKRADDPPAPAPAAAAPEPPIHRTEAWKRGVPVVRVGISSTGMGRPRPRRSATVRGSGAWRAVDPKTGRVLLTAEPGEAWTVRLIPAKKVRSKNKKKKRRTIPARLEFHSANGRVAAVPGIAALLRPLEPETSTFTLEDDRVYRGDLELALYGGRRTIRVVNVISLEDYTHGVVSAEMPQRAPLEALKAQAVVARTHALYIKTVTRRHRKEGYDLCDEQHCQVYGGRRAETERTRAVVVDTRGRVATYKGRPAHVIYSSHCGGRTQSGVDVGWGYVPYWKSVDDSHDYEAPPATPLELRLLLSDWPKGFDRPSGYVHPAHARWTRAVPAKELEEKLDRRFKIGRLRGLRVLRRVPSGHVKSLLIIGSRSSKILRDEMAIRSFLGVGSLRSTMFVVDTEYRKVFARAAKSAKGKKAGKPVASLVPETFVFRGGGWGHAVGLCQSGAMGRAEAGQDYGEIVRAYFLGVDIGKLGY
ncbi:MAG: SpoIID/LytB domain-containing protein, partial [Elusimicrobia bacterium]|nr:SpoIID/LytB domain-containing protein [Elusimicrobiota bacterium]